MLQFSIDSWVSVIIVPNWLVHGKLTIVQRLLGYLAGTPLKAIIDSVPPVYGGVFLFLFIVALARVLLSRPRRSEKHYIVDESCFPHFKLVGKVAREYSLEEIPTLVQEMRKSFDSGITRPIAKRKEQIRQLHKFFIDNEERIIEVSNSNVVENFKNLLLQLLLLFFTFSCCSCCLFCSS